MATMSKSILQDWVSGLGLRQQGVLVSGIRGCDTVMKDDPIKYLARLYRGAFMVPHCGDITKAASYMAIPKSLEDFHGVLNVVIKSHDHYPFHYLMHMIHGAQILGLYHPNMDQAIGWAGFYQTMCKKLHMNAETREELETRLGCDEETFRVNQ